MTDQKQDKKCPDCGGTGSRTSSNVIDVCPQCNGTGTAPSSPPNELDSILEKLVIHTANEYGGFEGFDDDDSRDGINEAKTALEALIAHAVLEARQDELYKFKSAARKAQGLLGGHAVISAEAIRSQVNERLAELAAQKEKQ